MFRHFLGLVVFFHVICEDRALDYLGRDFSGQFEDSLVIENQRIFGRLLQIPETFWLRERLINNVKLLRTPPDTEDLDLTSNQCTLDLDYVVSSINQTWALKMLDAAAKVESGILYYQLYWSGNYDECLNVSAPPGENTTGFHGRYCYLVFNPAGAMTSIIQSAVCIPDSCNASEVQQYFSRFITYLEKIPLVEKIVKALNWQGINCISESVPWDNSAITYTFFIACLIAIVLIATSYDVYTRKKSSNFSVNDPSNCDDFLPREEENFSEVDLHNRDLPLINVTSPEPRKSLVMCFSALNNASKIMSTKHQEGQLDCLHGIRFLSMSWVILGHTYTGGIAQMSNIASFLGDLDTLAVLTIVQGSFAVDSFFFLSGFLLAYLFLKDGFVRMGVRKWAYFYVHRYLRLTPTYAMVIGMYASLWLYVGSGPFWQFAGVPDQTNCQTNWWQNLLYINNFPNATKMCMGWSWYLANDMQFFVISPVFLYPLMRWPIAGVIITVCLMLASMITTGVLSYVNNLITWGSELNNLNDALVQQTNYMDMIYIKPYTRIAPYLIGVLVAVCYLHYRKKGNFLNKWIMWTCWLCSTAMTLTTIYGLYHAHMGLLTSAFYNALSRSAFTLGLGWVTFACLTGYGGPINWILTWKIWIPVSRLTYCAYLIHPLITLWYFGTLKHTFYFSHATVVLNYFGVMVISYVAAFAATLVIESPIISVEKHFGRRFK